MPVPNTFANATATIPLTQLDANFATTITLGNTAIQLGNTVTTLNNMTLANVTISSGNVTVTNVSVTTANVTTLSVTGNANVNGNATLGNATTNTVTVAGFIGINGATPAANTPLRVGGTASGSATQIGVYANMTFDSSAIAQASGFRSTVSTAAASYTIPTLAGFRANDITKGASSVITGQNGVYIDDQTQGTNNYGLTTVVSSGANKWNIYASGTAANYFAGDVGIGTSSPGYKLDITGPDNGISLNLRNSTGSTIRLGFGYVPSVPVNNITQAQVLANGSGDLLLSSRTDFASGITFYTNAGVAASERMRLDSAGNLGLGVTPSAWGYTALQIKSGSVYEHSSSDFRMLQNAYYASGNAPKYINTGLASMYRQESGTHYWYNAPSGTAGNAISFTQAMTLDASGNLAVGTTSSTNKQTIQVSNTSTTPNSESGLSIYNSARGNNYQATVKFGSYESNNTTRWTAAEIGAAFTSYIDGANSGALLFSTSNAGTVAERARITSGGSFLVGTTNTDPPVNNVVGISLEANGTGKFSRDGEIGLDVNRKTNDGTLVRFFQDGTQEGSISVSGSTVSYNGGHLARYSQLPSGQRDEAIVKGTVLSNLDEMCEWLDAEGNPLPNEQLNRTKVSDVEGDTNVAGVFVNWDNDDQDNPYDMNIAMTGDMIIRIAQGVTVQKGDLLMSAGDGTAKPQGDDIVRSKTVAKVTSNHVTCTYEDGSYCVPCVLMAC